MTGIEDAAFGLVFKFVGRVAIPVMKAAGGFVVNASVNALRRSKIPHVAYGLLDRLKRPTIVRALLDDAAIDAGTDAARRILPPGFGGEAAGHARGHLLARVLGGTGDFAENLVTLYHNPVNTPVMWGIEKKILDALKAGELMDFSAIPKYIGNNLIPDSIRIVAKGGKGLNIDEVIFNWP